MQVYLPIVAAALLSCVIAAETSRWEMPPVGITGINVTIAPISLNETTTYTWATQQCADLDYADVPARAFRLSAATQPCETNHSFCSLVPGQQREVGGPSNVRIIAASGAQPGNWASTAPAMSAAKWFHNCTKPVLLSENRTLQVPQTYTGPLWIATTYRFFPKGSENAMVLALAHLEFHGELQAKNTGFCPSGELDQCWDATIVQGLSSDDGLTFHPPTSPPERLAMANPFRYVPDGGRQGMAMQTNMISPGDGYVYMLVLSTVVQLPRNRSGMCVFRTADPANLSAWRAWNGTESGWSVSTIDPYQNPVGNATLTQSLNHVCQPVLDASFRFGLNYHKETGTYVAFGVGPPAPGQPDTETMVYTWSNSLVNWPFGNSGFTQNTANVTGTIRSMTGISGWSGSRNQTGRWYPSFIDPESPGINFEFITTPVKIGSSIWRSDPVEPPALFYTRLNARNITTNPFGRDRDTVNIKLSVTVEQGATLHVV